MKTFAEIRAINVNEKTEKKGKFTYLSWAWAVDQLLTLDPSATWEYKFFGERPYCQIGDTAMVFCTVTAFGKAMTAQLPVINGQNKAIPNPHAMDVNTAMQRCLAKAIALHGLGLYIYAGEDLPTDERDPADINEEVLALIDVIQESKTIEELLGNYKPAYTKFKANTEARDRIYAAYTDMKEKLGGE